MFQIPMCNILQSDIFSILKSPVLERIVFFLKESGNETVFIAYIAYTNSNKVGVFHVKLCSFVGMQISLVLIPRHLSRDDTLRRRCSQGCDLTLDFLIR